MPQQMPQMMPQMMPPMMPLTKGGKMQSMTKSVKPDSPPDIMIYIFSLLFIIAAALAAAVSSGSATFTHIPFDSIKGNSKNILNVNDNKSLLINTTNDVTESDYTINVTQDYITDANSNPVINMESKNTPVVNFNRYNASQVVPSTKLKGLKTFGNNTVISAFNAYSNTSIGKNKPPAKNNLAFISSIKRSSTINELAFATVTPTSDMTSPNPPQSNLVLRNDIGVVGQYPRPMSISSYNSAILNLVLSSGTETLVSNFTYILGSGVTQTVDYLLPESANIGDFINVIFTDTAPASSFTNGKLSFIAPKGLGTASTILRRFPPTSTKVLQGYDDRTRLMISTAGIKGVYVTVNDVNKLQISNVVLKFVYVNTNIKTSFAIDNFTQTWVAQCHSTNPNINIKFIPG